MTASIPHQTPAAARWTPASGRRHALIALCAIWPVASAAQDAPRTPPASAAQPITAHEIRGMFTCTKPGLRVVYSFFEGGGLATFDTAPGEERHPSVIVESDEEIVYLTPTIWLAWTFTAPDLLIVEIPWPDDTPVKHYLRVERTPAGPLILVEMQSPTGPDLDLIFNFDRDQLLAPDH